MAYSSTTNEITGLLQAWSDGDAAALERLTPVIYDELYRIAKSYMRRERTGHTLQTTALVNEAYVRLMDWRTARFENRAQFFGASARIMRRILVDFARKRNTAPAQVQMDSLDGAFLVRDRQETDVVAVHEALTNLATFDKRKARIVELRFFGGLTVEETAAFMKLSERTVLREWNKSKLWLYRELNAR
jgi:RNA polymerase sigma-70 factor (ECF subfamily)